MKPKLDYEKMIKDVYEVIEKNGNFLFDIECKNIPKAQEYTQKEAKKMQSILGSVYMISHCVSCNACQRKYIIKESI